MNPTTYIVLSPNGVPWSHGHLSMEDARRSRASAEERMQRRHGQRVDFRIVPAEEYAVMPHGVLVS